MAAMERLKTFFLKFVKQCDAAPYRAVINRGNLDSFKTICCQLGRSGRHRLEIPTNGYTMSQLILR